MLPIDSLVIIGLSIVSLGTINEADGRQEREFWLRNAGTEAVSIVQGYTSCGCVKLDFPLDKPILPGDSARTVLSFDPKGKGGEFYERGTIIYGSSRKRINLALEGNCITSEETLARQFPVKINENIRLSTNKYDLGVMSVGESKTRNIAVLHKDEGNRQEYITIKIEVDNRMGKGVKRIEKHIKTKSKNEVINITIYFDVRIK